MAGERRVTRNATSSRIRTVNEVVTSLRGVENRKKKYLEDVRDVRKDA